ncbi:MAG: hypothetical protein FIA90_01450 [candidate division NC10 bacterium]|nr:hypothetical protein [candidate division NC10 bacterium]
MSFRDDIPDYESYQDGPLFYTRIPPTLVAPLKELILKGIRSAEHLKTICNDIASRVPCEPTQNIGWDWLINDLDVMLERVIRKRKLHKFMDFLHDFADGHGGTEFVEELNTILYTHNFGYRLVPDDRDDGEGYTWDIHKAPE